MLEVGKKKHANTQKIAYSLAEERHRVLILRAK
jgi:hypothetical protein